MPIPGGDQREPAEYIGRINCTFRLPNLPPSNRVAIAVRYDRAASEIAYTATSSSNQFQGSSARDALVP
jgi:hypothetical protein